VNVHNLASKNISFTLTTVQVPKFSINSHETHNNGCSTFLQEGEPCYICTYLQNCSKTQSWSQFFNNDAIPLSSVGRFLRLRSQTVCLSVHCSKAPVKFWGFLQLIHFLCRLELLWNIYQIYRYTQKITVILKITLVVLNSVHDPEGGGGGA
jgi:hypothetical protein